MKKIFFYSLIVTILLSGASFAKADIVDSAAVAAKTAHDNIIPDKTSYKLLEPLPCVEGTGNNCKAGETIPAVTINQYIGYVFKFSIALAVFLATVVIIFSGFQYMLAETSIASKSAARTRINNAILGLLGALASYLILATIDPRLVNVGVTIEQLGIKIAPETTAFQSQLDKDLKTLSTENINKVYALEQEVKDLQSKKEVLQTKINNGEGNLEENSLEMAKLDQQTKEIKSKQIDITVTEKMQKSFNEAMSGLHSENSTTKESVFSTKGELNKSAIENAKKQIEEMEFYYNAKIADPNLDPVIKQKLEFQKNFLVKQINEEQGFLVDVIKNNTGNTLGRTQAQASKVLEDQKADYNKQLEFLNLTDSSSFKVGNDAKKYETLTGVKGNPDLSSQYKTLLQDRINIIDSSLANSKVKKP